MLLDVFSKHYRPTLHVSYALHLGVLAVQSLVVQDFKVRQYLITSFLIRVLAVVLAPELLSMQFLNEFLGWKLKLEVLTS